MQKFRKWWIFTVTALTPAITMAGEFKNTIQAGMGVGALLVFVLCCVKIWHLIATKDQRDNTMTEIVWTCAAAAGSAIIGVVFGVAGMGGAVVKPDFDKL